MILRFKCPLDQEAEALIITVTPTVSDPSTGSPERLGDWLSSHLSREDLGVVLDTIATGYNQRFCDFSQSHTQNPEGTSTTRGDHYDGSSCCHAPHHNAH